MLDVDERKAAILRAVVEEYVESGQPVGSGHVARARGVDVSSATVRNDMAALEEDGLLRQPHTSAGRVPTEKGYRYFVDHLQRPARLASSSDEEVRAFFARAHGEVEEMLDATSRLLSDLTKLTSVLVAPSPIERTIRSVQLVGLTSTSAILVVVLSDGAVEKHTVELPADVDDGRLAAASAHLAAHITDRRRDAVGGTSGVVPEVGDAATDALVAEALDALAGPPSTEAEHLYVGGTARMAQAFDAIETVREVLGILEQQYVVVSLIRSVIDRGLHVAIGTETGMAPLAECALVVSPYEVEGERAGTIGVLGPTRMNYPQALAAVAVVGHRLSDRLTEG
ncbi:MAG TPA: heat-inducible transcriptional repressor HrcA [Acidimicrobiales bacterium]|jgi:heat-inducible transcriptional repressor|nr:heat-inducible transcriptional repressor HrcA [Acidimicrobiales bacterium]